MESQFQHQPINEEIETDKKVKAELEQLKSRQYQKNIYFSPSEVWDKIRRLNNNKAPGPNGISNSALKYSGKKVVLKLAHTFNLCIRLEREWTRCWWIS